MSLADFNSNNYDVKYVKLKPAPTTKTFNKSKSGVNEGDDNNTGKIETYESVVGAADELTLNSGPYLVQVDIHNVSATRLYFGVAKTDATQSSADATSGYGSNRKSYYHDTDWVCADQFMLFYLGSEEAVVLKEDKANLNYIDDATYTNRNVRMKREFVKNAWNSFVTPLAMTASQVRTAFGDGTRVAVLDGIGTISEQPGVLDFKSVPLPAEGKAIEAGKFYLIKPVKDPISSGDEKYYDLGMHSFQRSQFVDFSSETVKVQFPEIDGTVISHGSYVASNPYTKETDASLYTNNVYVPAGSYVVGSNASDGSFTSTKLYHIANNMPIKAFRGWLEEPSATGEAKLHSMILNPADAEGTTPTAINHVTTMEPVAKEGVYDLMGRRVAADAKSLPKGLYIINGKKCIIK